MPFLPTHFPPLFFHHVILPASCSGALDDQLAELRTVVDKIAASLATVQGNKGQLTVAVNQLQNEKLLSSEKTGGSSTGDAVTHAARHSHKLLFPTFNGTDDPLSWLNRCRQGVLGYVLHDRRRVAVVHSPRAQPRTAHGTSSPSWSTKGSDHRPGATRWVSSFSCAKMGPWRTTRPSSCRC
jgi:hypothetical protein